MAIHRSRKAIIEQPFAKDAKAQITIDGGSEESYTPMFWHDCSFTPEIFHEVMQNLIRNPNINSNHLFRADILLDVPFGSDFVADEVSQPRTLQVEGFDLKTVMVRKMIPRNILVDKPLDQTCLIYERNDDSISQNLVIYLPHIHEPSESPFYHPAVRGIAFLHTYDPSTELGSISTHFDYFAEEPSNPALDRIAYHLLAIVHKHGQGSSAGYQKRVHHDTIIPQATVQNTYARLKSKYAKILIANWAEVTDPTKHVFEDLSIAAFLMELWADMYPEPNSFPGFVDIGCGNGLLVHILIQEGYEGWGFDARRRKSWATYSKKAQENLKELVLIPILAQTGPQPADIGASEAAASQLEHSKVPPSSKPGTHFGAFPEGTFIISNHADELTPWTPLLAHQSLSPFIAIPCCSHNLTGARFRAPALKTTLSSTPTTKSATQGSAYASLVAWVEKIADDCGWHVEREMLRIPSTRNTAIIGRTRKSGYASGQVDAEALVAEYGGAEGWEVNAMKLVKGAQRGH